MPPDTDSTPLLPTRTDSYSSFDTDCQSKFTLDSRIVRLFFRRRFWWFCILGVAAIITLQLSFLPRTSLNRDFRRWHDLHLTKTDVKRIFLVELRIGRPDQDGLTIEQHVNALLRNFTDINKKHLTGLAASDAPELAEFVERQMHALGFKTQSHKYPVLSTLHLPRTLSMNLLDAKSGRKLYTTPLVEPKSQTPAYFAFGRNGTVRAEFVYANRGELADFSLLQENDISLQDKIVIISHSLTSEYALADKILYAERLGCAAVVVQGDLELDTAISRDFKPNTAPSDQFRIPVSYSLVLPVLKAMGTTTRASFGKWKYPPVCVDSSLQLELTTEFDPQPLNATHIVAQVDGVINDGEIIVGASRDILTSLNPLSGHAVMLEVMRRFHNLRELGWRPLRTIRFVSWDAERSSSVGPLASANDPAMFQTNLPIVAYINLDDDLVAGSHFCVDANPLFNHLVADIAKLVPFPKTSPYYKRLLKHNATQLLGESMENLSGEDDDDNEGDDDSEITTLHRYWHLQNNATINNKIGHVIAGKDLAMFQLLKAAPVVNFRYLQSPFHNDSVYVPESNFYNYKWLTEMDKSLDLHGLLVRFLGLFVLSLGEHEVVDTRANSYFTQVKVFFKDFENAKKDFLKEWEDSEVHESLLLKSSLYNDLKAAMKVNGDVTVTMGAVFQQMNTLLRQLVNQSLVFDEYNKGVEDLLTVDYPWYKLLRKLHIYAKFKLANYKLLRLEKELNLHGEDEDNHKPFHHFMYEVPKGFLTNGEKQKRGAFASLYEAADEENEKEMVKLIVTRYESLKSVLKKMT